MCPQLYSVILIQALCLLVQRRSKKTSDIQFYVRFIQLNFVTSESRVRKCEKNLYTVVDIVKTCKNLENLNQITSQSPCF